MTCRELRDYLNEVDEDILDFNIGVISSAQIGRDIRISVRCDDVILQENADIGAKIFWFKAKVESK